MQKVLSIIRLSVAACVGSGIISFKLRNGMGVPVSSILSGLVHAICFLRHSRSKVSTITEGITN